MLKKFRIKLNDKEYIVEMEDLNPEVQFQAGSMPSVENTKQVNPTPTSQVKDDVPPKENTVASAAPGEGEEVTAPMPGTILEVHVQTGDTVQENQAILVLEAMKMENQIVSPKMGTVTSILVEKGQSVDVGTRLFTVD